MLSVFSRRFPVVSFSSSWCSSPLLCLTQFSVKENRKMLQFCSPIEPILPDSVDIKIGYLVIIPWNSPYYATWPFFTSTLKIFFQCVTYFQTWGSQTKPPKGNRHKHFSLHIYWPIVPQGCTNGCFQRRVIIRWVSAPVWVAHLIRPQRTAPLSVRVHKSTSLRLCGMFIKLIKSCSRRAAAANALSSAVIGTLHRPALSPGSRLRLL